MVTQLENLANSYFEKGKYSEAEDLLKKVVANDPTNADALHKLGYINVAKMNYKIAEMLLEAAVKNGADTKALALLAYVKEHLFEMFDAIVMYERVLELKPEAWLYEKICNLYIQMELYENAVGITQEYIQKFPTPVSYRRMFLLYLNLSKTDELKKLCDDISQKFPNQGLAINLLGMYKEFIEKDINGAEKLYERAMKIGAPTAGFDLALLYKKTGKYDEAEKCCKKIMNFYPRKQDVCNLLTEIYFTQKKMRKGYKYYMERPLTNDVKSLTKKWDGKENKSEKILVYSDVGDLEIIRNIRYLHLLKDKCKNYTIAISEQLEPIFAYNKIPAVKRSEIASVKYDKYVLLSELPYYLNTNFENIPFTKLKSEKKNIGDAFKIGLLWSAHSDNIIAASIDSVDISVYFRELLSLEDIEFYSFQKNDIYGVLEKYPQIYDLSNDLENYKDYADYLSAMDLVIAIDSPALHLAGTLGIPVYAIISYNSEWYWFDNNKKTELYPTVEIYKQKFGEDWKRISQEITEKVKNGKHKKAK